MEAPELGMMVLVASLVTVAALAVPVIAVAVHQRRRRSFERAASHRRKEKIRL